MGSIINLLFTTATILLYIGGIVLLYYAIIALRIYIKKNEEYCAPKQKPEDK